MDISSQKNGNTRGDRPAVDAKAAFALLGASDVGGGQSLRMEVRRQAPRCQPVDLSCGCVLSFWEGAKPKGGWLRKPKGSHSF